MIICGYLIAGGLLLACDDNGSEVPNLAMPGGAVTQDPTDGAALQKPWAENGESQGYDVFLVVGQSNTHYGKGLDAEKDKPLENAFQLGRGGERDLKILPAIEPLDHFSKQADRIGFALSFAKTFVAQGEVNGRKVLIIPGGQGSTSFLGGSWKRTGALYQDAVFRSNYVLSQYPGSRLMGILWHQGESDFFNSQYKKDLDQFISNIRSDIKRADHNTPFVLGGLVPKWIVEVEGDVGKARRELEGSIAATINRVPFTGFADSENPEILKYNYTSERIHFDATGQRELGRRYFSAYMRARQNSLEAKKPSVVRHVKVIGKSNKVTLYWFKPDENHDDITGYRVLFREHGEREWHERIAPPPLNDFIRFDVSPLKNGVIYDFTVAALNSKGEGEHASPVSALPSRSYDNCLVHFAFTTPDYSNECGSISIAGGTLFKIWSGESGLKWFVSENRSQISRIRLEAELPAGSYTKTIWFKVNAELDSQELWHLISSSPGAGHALVVTGDGRLAAGHNEREDEVRSDASLIVNDRWYHAAATYQADQNRLKLFLNGNLVAEGVTAPFTTTDLQIGNSKTWALQGSIFDVRIYSGSALDATDIRSIYENTRPMRTQ